MDRLTTCRTCLAPDPYLFLPLGDHAPAQMLIKPEDLERAQPSFPLNAQVCLECGLVEVADQIPADFFRHYLYVPSGAATMQSHFREFAGVLAQHAGGTGLIVDIGCNDGLLLAACNALGCKTLGIDPAANIAEIANGRGVNVHVAYFHPETAAKVAAEHGKARIIVTTNTFNHIGDLHNFMRGIDILLADDGMFVIEVPRAKELIDHNEFDNVYHEHVSEFSLLSLVKLGEFFDMDVTDVHRLPNIHGGSMRVFLTRNAAGAERTPIVQEMLDEEAAGGMLEASTYQALVERVDQIGAELRQMLSDLKAQGLKIAGYGASARGNTLITYFGIGPQYLDFLVDKNVLKHGLYSPNTRIPIKPVEAIETDKPDILFVLAWNFFDEIYAQQNAFLERGGKFVLPLPKPTLVGA
ncbi:class I SAM-dependent methyltransferase [Sphingomonas cavernae]|uniref:Class I SAM-dependent methyltransferase n=1 Tax=Sphingomonas cavernae TaxID=2320861 RepID=A0A418WR58_9SPHN|nr:class I SAM-dependent methyltransferase [Sphingomonas cavernae]RJF93649.1 class I SAM-dependent methyltransferase [Sphingomonas cavernae]